MILFTFKVINTIRKAIAGRKYPSQLAWGVAFGVLVGLIPHGNLLAVALVLFVLSLRVNHAMVALVGVGVTLVAPNIDPTFDAVGRWFFAQPDVSMNLAKAWQFPLVAWTDLNNTVVAGSFLIGLVALVPLFLLTYPIFRALAPADEESGDGSSPRHAKPRKNKAVDEPPVHRVDTKHNAAAPHVAPAERPQRPSRPAAEKTRTTGGGDAPMTATSGRVYDVRRIDPGTTNTAAVKPSTPAQPVRQTLVAIAGDKSPGATGSDQFVKTKLGAEENLSAADDQQKIDEALSYLLRQLRDSQDKDAA
ncbi:TIGR03546 family protein [Aporhodopirellula aestuarii]